MDGTRPLSIACEGFPAAASRRTVSAVRQHISNWLSLGRMVMLKQGHEHKGFSRVGAESFPQARVLPLPLRRVGYVRLISREGCPRALVHTAENPVSPLVEGIHTDGCAVVSPVVFPS